MNYIDKIDESIGFIKERIKEPPEIGIILGSGLGSLGEKIRNPKVFSYDNIPNFPISSVDGHKGQLIVGKLAGKEVIVMQGRFHYYEGHNMKQVVFPIRVLIGLGIKNLIVTNAAGGVNKDFSVGDFMIIRDHINFTGQNPLIGQNYEDLGPRFVDMTNAYDNKLINITKNVGEELDIPLHEGVYMWFSGPTYETPAEIRLARILGAAAVGMSTVPEVIIANHQKVGVLGISCITNMAAGILDQPLVHEEVIETSLVVEDKFQRLIIEILKKI